MKKPSDCDLILEYLISNEGWNNAIDMHRSIKPNCVNWALRSRCSDLRRKGYNIESRIGANRQAEYRLVIESKPVFTADSCGQYSFI